MTAVQVEVRQVWYQARTRVRRCIQSQVACTAWDRVRAQVWSPVLENVGAQVRDHVQARAEGRLQ